MSELAWNRKAQERRQQAAGCDGKKDYDTWAAALRTMERMRAYSPGERLNVYRCRFCQHYHIGSTGEPRP